MAQHNVVLWFCIAMGAALITYSIARNQLWVTDINCTTSDQTAELQTQVYLLNSIIHSCNSNEARTNYYEQTQHYQKRKEDCERLNNQLGEEVRVSKENQRGISPQCKSEECYQKLTQCEQNIDKIYNA